MTTRRRFLALVGVSAGVAPAALACGGGGGNPTSTALVQRPSANQPTGVVNPTPIAPASVSVATVVVVPTQPAQPPRIVPPTLAPARATAAPAASSPVGVRGRTLVMAFVPSSDSQRVLASGKPIGDMLARITGLTFDVQVPTNYTAVIEAVGASKIDVAWLSPFAYALAREKYGADVILSSVRQGSRTYVSQFIAHADSGIKDVRDFQGKRFAFVDAASASGYLYPAAMLRERGFDPARFFSQVVYAGGHDKVVIAVYQKNVDGGATTGRSSMEANAPPTDTRTRVQSTFPDVLQKVRIVAETEPIPNDTVSVRKGLEPAVVDALKTGLLQIAKDPEGQKHLRDLYTIDGLSEAKDSDYDRLRKVAQTLGMSLEQALQPAPMPTTSAAGTPAAGGTPTGTSR